MYLARKISNGICRYIIRESYPRGSRLLSRDLIDLGADPGRFIVYPGGRAYYIDEAVEEKLRRLDVSYDPWELDELFLPFLDPELRWKMKWISDRRDKKRPGGGSEKRPRADRYHLFDKRRIHFLRCGRMNQGSIGRLPVKMLRVLDCKSRDEIEQTFIQMEAVLGSREFKTYVFVIFDLQRFFTQSFARTAPQMLAQEAVDDFFVGEICRLNVDRHLWAGMPRSDALNEYLIRYLVMYFDYDYGKTRLMDDVLRDFINSRRRYRPPESVGVKLADAAAIFETSTDNLKRMKRTDLARLFRRRAQKLHPDKGGRHDEFVKLTKAYHSLLRKKP